MSPPALAELAAVLEGHLGLAPGALGDRAFGDAVARRQARTGTPDPAAYLARVRADRAELDELVEAVVVPETWFFRYPESLAFLGGWAGKRRTAGVKPLRVLSVPCSTGEEPYSIAIALLQAGIPADGFLIDAADVSRRVVQLAQAGVYPPSAFREADPPPAAYFTPAGPNRAVRPDVKARVTFRVGNLTDPMFFPPGTTYDAIFCRNLFIYLAGPARKTAAAAFARHLAADGLLFMGHAESFGLIDPAFRPAGRPQAFAFTRSSAVPVPHPPVASPGTWNPERERRGELAATATPSLTLQVPTDAHLAAARSAADAGRAAEALALCREAVAADPTADAYALLGVLHESAGDLTAAGRAFTQALYLDPGQYDALVHMMVLAGNRGDAAAAANYRRRAAAAQVREGGR